MTSRRELLLASAATALATPQADSRKIIKARALRPGDPVGLITPATYVSDPDAIITAERTLRHFELKPVFGRNVRKRHGYLGGSIDERLADLHAMFGDPAIKGVFCIRGGYGSLQLLDRIDYDLIRRNPKVFLGYSDITALHLAIGKRTGLVTFHGPVALSAFSEYTIEILRRALFSTEPLGTLANPPEKNTLRPRHKYRTIRPGNARGPITVGNLSLISATMGTQFEIDTRGKILLIEDVGEQPYSIDRMLTQLRLAGKLDAAAAIAFGECTDCVPRDFRPSFASTLSLGEVLDDIFGGLKIPVVSGLTFGHTDNQMTLPVGVTATLDADRGELTVEESGVV